MTTPNQHLQLNAFVDGELDLKTRLEIESQIESDPALRKQVDEMRQLRQDVREHAQYHAAPEDLRRRMTALLSGTPASSAPTSASAPARAAAPRPASSSANGRGPTIGEHIQRWLGWRPLAASLSFAAVLAVAVNVLWIQSSQEEHLSDDVVASHVRATLGQHLVDVSSSDHHTVKPFLSSKLGFSPPVSELQIAGSSFLGGRVDYIDGRPVAALVYKQGEHVVNSFVWPNAASDREPKFGAERGYLTAHWSRDGMTHWVISDVNREEFRAVVGAIMEANVDR
jgi:anti-sigma factor RsiW